MKTFADGMVEVHADDCLNVLRAMPDASVDACVTDPPYGLADHHPKIVEAALRAWLSGDREHVPDGRGFMGREWDRFVPPPAVWDECWRVLKPGGHLLAFAAPRTADLMSMSIRLAGFEIRDSIKWIFAQGMPKGQDVGKLIDRQRADRDDILRVTTWLNTARLAVGLTHKQIDATLGFNGMASHWMAVQGKAAAVPTWEQWEHLRALLGFGGEMDAEVRRLNARKGDVGESWAERDVVATAHRVRRESTVQVAGLSDGTYDVTVAATEEAKQWQGWNTQLKPAHEPIVVARKSTGFNSVVANVLEYGTGAINVDACRIPAGSPDGATRNRSGERSRTSVYGSGSGFTMRPGPRGDDPAGRWPTNVVLSHAPMYEGEEIVGDACADGCVAGCPVAELDRQSGIGRTNRPSSRGAGGQHGTYSPIGAQATLPYYADEGGASRFFPVFRFEAKASSGERPRAADGTQHVSVKPLGLMRWLVRLVTQPGGRVVDPFAGTGPTAEACVLEGFDCILMENHGPYLPLITARLSKPLQPTLDIFGGAA